MVSQPDTPAGGAGGRHGSPWRAVGATLVALSAIAGIFLMRAAVEAAPPPPQPIAEAAPPVALPGEPTTGGPAGGPATELRTEPPVTKLTPAPPAGLPRSAPTRITIPKIKVNAAVRALGVKKDGALEVPPLEKAQDAGWYRLGPSPGEVGNAVVVGHVDSRFTGPAVFYRLGALRPGDTITVTRQDGRTVDFRVDGVQAFPKTAFPTELVYGPTDKASLRVVTCGGKFDQASRSYVDNVVVFATRITPAAS